MPSIYPKKGARGVFYIQIEAGWNAQGKRKRLVRQFKGSKKGAQAELARLMAERGAGEYVEPSKETLGHFLERWLGHIEDGLAPSTFAAYRSIARQRWAAELGQVRLQQLQSTDISRVERAWRREGRLGRPRAGLGRALSSKTVLNFHRVLADALTQAVRWKLIPFNPADAEHMEPPRAARAEQSALSLEEAGRLMEAISQERLGAALHTLLATGLRVGEVLGLRWRDVDLEGAGGGVVRVVQQWDKVARVYREVKSHRSRRPVAIDAELVAALRKWRARQARITELVFTDAAGRGLHHDQLSYALEQCLRRAGLDHLGPHALRHTHASLLIGMGAHMKLVQERLGHSSFGITADTYSHLEPGMQRRAADQFGAALRSGQGGEHGPT